MGRRGVESDDLEQETETRDHPTNSACGSSEIAPEHQVVFEQAPDGIIVHDSDGQILDVNETASKKLGYTRAELVSMAVTDIEVGLDEERLQEKWQSMDTGSMKRLELEGIHRRKDGSTFPVAVWVSRLEPEQAETDRFVALARDITERKEHERELERQERKYRNLFEESRDALMLLDREGYLDCNEAALELFGFDSVAEFTDYSPWGLAPSTQPDGIDSQAAAKEHIEHAFEEGEDFFEWAHTTGDGKPFSAEVKLSRFETDDGPALLALVRDVSGRKERAQELKRYEHLWRNLPVGVCRIDPSGDGEFVEVNETLVDILGCESREALLQQPVAELWEKEHQGEAFLERVDQMGRETTEHRFETLDGRTIWLRTIVMPQEEGSHLDVVAQDVTERRQREIHLENAQEVGNIGWWRKDIPSDEIYWSEQIYDMWGAEGAVGLIDHGTFMECIHPDDRENVNQAWEAAKQGEDYDIEHRIVTDDGQTRWMREKAELTFDEAGDPIHAVGVVQDITERKKRELELERQKAFTDDLLDAIEDVVYVLDTDGDLRDWNAALEDVTGYTSEELESMNALDFFKQADTKAAAAAMEEALETGRARVELDFLAADGESIPYEFIANAFEDPNGEPVIAGIGRDRSRHVEYERTLEEQRDFFEEIIESLPYPFYVLSVEDYTVEYANALATVGEGDTCYEITHRRDRPCDEGDGSTVMCPLSEVIESGEPTSVEHVHHSDDKEGTYRVYASPIFDDEDNVVRMAESTIDITERVEYEQTLEEQRDNLSILNQVVRHDLRNDMTVVRGRANLLAEHVEDSGKEDLEAVQDATESAIELTKTARDLAETMLSTEEDVEPVGLDQHLETPVETARSEFENAAIIADDRPPDVRVRGNDLLEAVFRNLIQNAIIHNDKDDPKVRISVTLDGETATVAVADNGPGVPDEQKETIFGKGEKGLESPGTGLGLYLVQTLVEQYGGDVWVEDNDPTGAVFAVRLPKATE